MRDTIDLLEAIGRDASLRHASAEALAGVLEKADATACLTMAVATGNPEVLAEEFDYLPKPPPTQSTQAPGWEEEEDDEDMDEPEREEDDTSLPH